MPVKTLTVTSTTDAADSNPGDGVCAAAGSACTLRAAVQEANATAGGPVRIVLQSGATYPLTAGVLRVTNGVEIEGNGATVSAPASTAFEVGPAGTAPDVTIESLTVSGANPSGPLGDVRGGILFDSGTLTVRGSTFVTNGTTSADGGAIDQSASAGKLTVSGSTFTNDEGTNGAAVAIRTSAEIDTTQFSSVSQGGVHVTSGQLAVALDTFEAPLVSEAGSELDGFDSTVVGPVTSRGTTTIAASTLVNPGGLAISNPVGTMTLSGSIVAGSTSGACANPVTSLGYNLVSDASCGVGAVGDRPGVVPVLGELAKHGGPTPTIEALTSEGIDAIPVGTPTLCDGTVPVDQREAPRPSGAGCDIGAVEQSLVHQSLTVNSAGDGSDANPGDGACAAADGTCTLRAAIDETNATPGADTITIASGINPAVAPTFDALNLQSNPPLTTYDSVIIHGNGATIASGSTNGVAFVGRFFDVEANWSGAQTTIDHVQFHGGPNGGSSAKSDEGLVMDSPGHLSITDSTFTNLESFGDGGIGILQTAGTLNVDRVTFANNQADGEFIVHCGLGGVPCVPGRGAGMWVHGGTATVADSTFVGNATSHTGGLAGGPANIFVDNGGSLTANHITAGVNDPLAPDLGSNGGTLTVRGSVLGGLSCPSAGDTYNLYDPAVCPGTFDPTNLAQTPIALGALASNGSPNQTELVPAGSPAIDAIPIGTAGLCDAATTTDQRGLPRPSGPACDMGSVERQPTDP
jgi:CSLREA domain-containing protein